MEELQCIFLGYGASRYAGEASLGQSRRQKTTFIKRGDYAFLPPEVADRMHPAELQLVYSCLPMGYHYSQLNSFCEHIASGGRRCTVLSSLRKEQGEERRCVDFSKESSIPGFYHTALATVLRQYVLFDYTQAVRCLETPHDIIMLKRLFEPSFALLTRMIACYVSDELNGVVPLNQVGLGESSGQFRDGVVNKYEEINVAGNTNQLHNTNSIPSVDNFSSNLRDDNVLRFFHYDPDQIPPTESLLTAFTDFINSPDLPMLYRAKLHETVYLNVLYHVAYFVSHGELLSAATVPAHTSFLNKNDNNNGTMIESVGNVARDFFLQPCESIIRKESLSDTYNSLQATQLVVDAAKLPSVISVELAALILKAGRERSMLLSELNSSKMTVHTYERSSGLGGTLRSRTSGGRSVPGNARGASQVAGLMYTNIKGDVSQRAPDDNLAIHHTSLLNKFQVAVPRGPMAAIILKVLDEKSDFEEVKEGRNIFRERAFPHDVVAEAIFRCLYDVSLCRKPDLPNGINTDISSNVCASVGDTDHIGKSGFSGPFPYFRSEEALLHNRADAVFDQHALTTTGGLSAEILGRAVDVNNRTSMIPSRVVHSPFFSVFNSYELEARVEAAKGIWSSALWSIVKHGGVPEASLAAITQAKMQIMPHGRLKKKVVSAFVHEQAAELMNEQEKRMIMENDTVIPIHVRKSSSKIIEGELLETTTEVSDVLITAKHESDTPCNNLNSQLYERDSIVIEPKKGPDVCGSVSPYNDSDDNDDKIDTASLNSLRSETTTAMTMVYKNTRAAIISTTTISFASIFYQLALLRDFFLCNRGSFWQLFVEHSFDAVCSNNATHGELCDSVTTPPINYSRIVHEAFHQATVTFGRCDMHEELNITAITGETLSSMQRRRRGIGSSISVGDCSGAECASTVFTSHIGNNSRGASGSVYSRYGVDSKIGMQSSRFRGSGCDVSDLSSRMPIIHRIRVRGSQDDELLVAEDSFTMVASQSSTSKTAYQHVRNHESHLADEPTALTIIRKIRRLDLKYHPVCGSAHLIVSPSALFKYKNIFQLYLQTKFALQSVFEARRVIGQFAAASYNAPTSMKESCVGKGGDGSSRTKTNSMSNSSTHAKVKYSSVILTTIAGSGALSRLHGTHLQLHDSHISHTYRGGGTNVSFTQGIVFCVDPDALSPLVALCTKIMFILNNVAAFFALEVHQTQYSTFLKKFSPEVVTEASEKRGRGVYTGSSSDALWASDRSPVGASNSVDVRKLSIGDPEIDSCFGSQLHVNRRSKAGKQKKPRVLFANEFTQKKERDDDNEYVKSSAAHRRFHCRKENRDSYDGTIPPEIQTVDAARYAHERLINDIAEASFLPHLKDTNSERAATDESREEIVNAIAELLCCAHMLRNLCTSPRLFSTVEMQSKQPVSVSSPSFYTLKLTQEAILSVKYIHDKVHTVLIPTLTGHLSVSSQPADRALWTRLDFNRWMSYSHLFSQKECAEKVENGEIPRAYMENNRGNGGVRTMGGVKHEKSQKQSENTVGNNDGVSTHEDIQHVRNSVPCSSTHQPKGKYTNETVNRRYERPPVLPPHQNNPGHGIHSKIVEVAALSNVVSQQPLLGGTLPADTEYASGTTACPIKSPPKLTSIHFPKSSPISPRNESCVDMENRHRISPLHTSHSDVHKREYQCGGGVRTSVNSTNNTKMYTHFQSVVDTSRLDCVEDDAVDTEFSEEMDADDSDDYDPNDDDDNDNTVGPY